MEEKERFLPIQACGATAEDAVTEACRDLRRKEHETVKKVSADMAVGRFQFNTAIAAVMELVNALYLSREKLGSGKAERRIFSSVMATVLTLLSPVAPHICAELWERLGHANDVSSEPWPKWDEKALVRDTVTIALQVNGKLRGTLEVPASADKAALETAALADPAAQRHLAGQTVRKVVVVPGKLVNIVAAKA